MEIKKNINAKHIAKQSKLGAFFNMFYRIWQEKRKHGFQSKGYGQKSP